MHRDVVRDESSGRADVDEARRIDVETFADVWGADLQKLNGMELEVLTAIAKPGALFRDPLVDVSVCWIRELFFERGNLFLEFALLARFQDSLSFDRWS